MVFSVFCAISQKHALQPGKVTEKPGRARLGREYSINQLPILENGHAVHEHKLDPLGVLQWLS